MTGDLSLLCIRQVIRIWSKDFKMVSVENLNSETVNFDSQNFDSKSFDFEVENWKIEAEKRKLNFAAKNFDITGVVACMNFGSDSAIEVVDSSVQVLRILDCYL